jgi:uncharacterized membrane protein YgaE (UPF0421/DUF939 family)
MNFYLKFFLFVEDRICMYALERVVFKQVDYEWQLFDVLSAQKKLKSLYSILNIFTTFTHIQSNLS